MSNAMKRVGYGYVSNIEQAIIEKLSREEKRMHAIIYTKPHCQKCRRTVIKLSSVMPVQTITADADDYERFKAKGYQSMPVVEILQDGKQLDEWSDMRVDKIKNWNEV